MEEYDQKNTSFSDKFGMLMHDSDTYHQKLSAHVSLKVSTKGSFRDKNFVFRKQKQKDVTIKL